MDPRTESLDRLGDELQRLISVLDGAKSDAGASIDVAWARCRAAFEEFRSLDCERGASSTVPPAELAERAQRVMRLHAIAQHSTKAWMDAIGGERRRLAKARAQLDSIAGEARIGHSCNVAG